MQQLTYKNILNKINFFSCLLFIFWLPFKDDYLPIILALWIITWLLQGNFKSKFKDSNKLLFISLFVYFILTVTSLLFSNDLNFGLFQVQKKLSLVFFPIFLLNSSDIFKRNYKTFLLVFVIANFIASLYCLGNAFLSNLIFEGDNWYIKYWLFDSQKAIPFFEQINMRINVFSYDALSIFKHSGYFALYITFSIIIIIYFLINKDIKKRRYKLLSGTLIVFFILMIYLLQSRGSFISFGIAIFIISINELRKKLKKRYIVTTLFFVCLTCILFLSSYKLKNNFIYLKKVMNSEEVFSISESDIRFQLWYTSSKVAIENIWLGTSPANLYEELVNKYKELGFYGAAEKELNAHNQYLESFAGLGIFGLLSLLFIMGYSFYISIKEKHYLLFFLMLILSINFLFESMLNRMAGVLFMMFFLSLFVFMRKPSDELEQKQTINSIKIE